MENIENKIEIYIEEAINYFSSLPAEKSREYEKRICRDVSIQGTPDCP